MEPHLAPTMARPLHPYLCVAVCLTVGMHAWAEVGLYACVAVFGIANRTRVCIREYVGGCLYVCITVDIHECMAAHPHA